MTRMRRFLLYVHTGRRAALNALQTVLAELTAHEVRGVIVDEQVDEIRALPDSDVPPGLRETLTGSDVDVLDAVSAEIGRASCRERGKRKAGHESIRAETNDTRKPRH